MNLKLSLCTALQILHFFEKRVNFRRVRDPEVDSVSSATPHIKKLFGRSVDGVVSELGNMFFLLDDYL